MLSESPVDAAPYQLIDSGRSCPALPCPAQRYARDATALEALRKRLLEHLQSERSKLQPGQEQGDEEGDVEFALRSSAGVMQCLRDPKEFRETIGVLVEQYNYMPSSQHD
jgi:hypothetical protein